MEKRTTKRKLSLFILIFYLSKIGISLIKTKDIVGNG
jgi:hypothetical protein